MDRRSVAIAGHTGDVGTARRGLASADGSVRATALAALARLEVLTDDELAAALIDADPTVRRRAASLAAGHGAVDLVVVLADDDPAVVEAAAWACGEREGAGDDVLEALVALAGGAGTGREPLVRESAVAALGGPRRRPGPRRHPRRHGRQARHPPPGRAGPGPVRRRRPSEGGRGPGRPAASAGGPRLAGPSSRRRHHPLSGRRFGAHSAADGAGDGGGLVDGGEDAVGAR